MFAFPRMGLWLLLLAACSQPTGAAQGGGLLGEASAWHTLLADGGVTDGADLADSATGSTVGNSGSDGGESADVPICPKNLGSCAADASAPCQTPLLDDPLNCGTCDVICPGAANAAGICTAGQCGLACLPQFADCNATMTDGCEVPTGADINNCNACGYVCKSGENSTASCVDGQCLLQCSGSTGDCDGDPSTGCEAHLKTDAKNCGVCGNACKSSCVEGTCECAGSSFKAEPLPLDMYVMMDRSGSMSELVPGGMNKWSAVKKAMQQFFADPKSAGIGVGMQFFPINESCSVATYATPAVPIALLPGSAPALNGAIAGVGPAGNTPTYPALAGAVQYAQTWAKAHPTHSVIAVLATDGNPTICPPKDIPSIAKLAANGVGGQPKILTFVIGVGKSLANLNAIAAAGGTKAAFIVDTGADVVAQFAAALKQIQGMALSCTYLIPVAADGSKLDYSKVNVRITFFGKPPMTLPYVDAAAKCDPQKGGWFYDNPTAPASIQLCPATCTALEADDKAKVDIVLGCQQCASTSTLTSCGSN